MLIVPVYELEHPGVYYNTAAVIDADGSYLGKHRKTPHPPGRGLLGEVLLPAGQPWATRSSTPPLAGSASTSATTATSPRAGGPSASAGRGSCSTLRRRAGACPSTSGGWSSRRPRSPTSTSSATINRVGSRAARRRTSSTGSLLRRPPRPACRRGGLRRRGGGRRPRPRHGLIDEVRRPGPSTATAAPTPTSQLP